MQVALRGSSASTVITGILLLTHAKRLGHPIRVAIEGDLDEAATVEGPALVYSPVLSGCGVGKVPSSNALVCVSGAATEPLLVSLEHGGLSDWFSIDRGGEGLHDSTKAVVRLCRHPDAEGKNLGRVLRGALAAVGCPAEPALLDLLFGAPVPPLERVALALKAGRSMTGAEGGLFTRYIQSGTQQLPDPLPTPLTPDVFHQAQTDGSMERILGRLQPGLRDAVLDWLNGVKNLDDEADMTDLVCSVAEVGSHLVALPMAGMLPVMGPERQAIGAYLGQALGAAGPEKCAMRTLIETFQFLGGTFVEHSAFAVSIVGEEPPDTRRERWSWLCRSAYSAKEEADALWRKLIDPVQ